jgi:hypothetical protein
MSHKDAGAKQTQDYSDHFNHLTHPRALPGTSGSGHRFQDRVVSSTKWFRAYRRLEQPGSVAAFPFPTKQFPEADETGLKPRSAPIVSDQTMEFATILNAIYRELTRTSFRRKDRPGADLAWRLISSCKWRLIRGSLAARGNTSPRRLELRGEAK